jgi:hypothetical protein
MQISSTTGEHMTIAGVCGRLGMFAVWAMAWISLGAGVAGAEVDPFQCYKARTADGTTPFVERPASLKNALGDGSYQVKAPRSLCNPADIVGESSAKDGTAHLECYKVVPDSFTAFPPTRRAYENEFGLQRLDIGAPRRLCVPTIKNDEPSTLAIDHFACYAATQPEDAAPFSHLTSTVADQFRTVRETAIKPKLVCTPTKKNGESIESPHDRLVCFKVVPETAITPLLATTENQFGAETLSVQKAGLLCLPSREVRDEIGGDGCETSEDCPQGQFCVDGQCQTRGGCEEQCGECEICSEGQCINVCD